MLPASSATLAIMAAGQMKRIDLYAITLAPARRPTTSRRTKSPVVVGNQLYQTGLIINRGTSDANGRTRSRSDAGDDFTESEQQRPASLDRRATDHQGGQSTGVRRRTDVVLEDVPESTSTTERPGTFHGSKGGWTSRNIGRLTVSFQVSSDGEMLNVSAPPNLIEKRCRHTLFDAGCALVAANFQSQWHRGERKHRSQRQYQSDAARQVLLPGPDHIPIWTECDESEHDVLREVFRAYQRSVPARQRPLPNVPQAGDLFVALPGCPKTRAACINTSSAVSPPFNNGGRFRGILFVPVPETLYDGGTTQNQTQSIGGDGGSGVGSPFSSGLGQRNVYKP
jgi:hypothetical protein